MDTFLGKSRVESIESLKFASFYYDSLFPLVNEYKYHNNLLIRNFVEMVDIFCSLEIEKVNSYKQLLVDSVFWQSRVFYYETMQNFVAGKLNALEFSQEFWDRLMAEKVKANSLVENFQKQAEIELDPKSFKFSGIILNFELILECYQDEMEQVEDKELSENDLSYTEDTLKEIVNYELERVKKYFTD